MYSAILMTLVHVWVCASQFKTSTSPPPGYLTIICAQGDGSQIFVYNCDDLHIILHPAILIIYDFNIWITSSSSFHGFTTNQFNDLFPVGLLTQFVRELHLVSQRSRIRVPYKPDFFFRLSFRNCKSCVYNCRDLLSDNSHFCWKIWCWGKI